MIHSCERPCNNSHTSLEHYKSHLTVGTAMNATVSQKRLNKACCATKCHLMIIRAVIYQSGQMTFVVLWCICSTFIINFKSGPFSWEWVIFLFKVSCWKRHNNWTKAFEISRCWLKRKQLSECFSSYTEHSSSEVWIATCCNFEEIQIHGRCCSAPVRCHAPSIFWNHENFTLIRIFVYREHLDMTFHWCKCTSSDISEGLKC